MRTVWLPRRRSLVDLTQRALDKDPGDAPVVQIEADLFADDLERYAPTAPEPIRDYTL